MVVGGFCDGADFFDGASGCASLGFVCFSLFVLVFGGCVFVCLLCFPVGAPLVLSKEHGLL